MRHFKHLAQDEIDRLFFIKPADFDKNTELSRLKFALGASLYIPAVKSGILEMFIGSKYPAMTSAVLCLEDSIGSEQTAEAMENLDKLFCGLYEAIQSDSTLGSRLPLIFIRIREQWQLEKLLSNQFVRQLACGFVLPKYAPQSGKVCLELIDSANKRYGSKLYALPLIESALVIDRATRIDELVAIKASLSGFSHLVLNIRVGGTDFSGLYGLRRSVGFSVYDLRVVADCLTDILNVFCLSKDGYDGAVVSGPVWEYFSGMGDTRKITELIKQGAAGRQELNAMDTAAVDGLIKETKLDLLNGFVGKTVIHPSQISIVNAFQAVSFEEYGDAKMIAEETARGVAKSAASNKMNETSPHKKWAEKILTRAAVYGVLKQDEYAQSLF